MDLPADGLAAVDILDRVQVVMLPAHRQGQVRDVPRPDLIGGRCRMAGGRRKCARRLGTTAPMPLVGGAQDAIKSSFQCQVTAQSASRMTI